jgi:hypothetical protein
MRRDFPHKPPDFPSDFTDEEFIAEGFLNGYCNIDPKGRFVGLRYLMGAHERLGREMLARVLRSEKGPPRELLRDLADLFDPESENPRKLEFKFRKKKRSNPDRDRAIASFVQRWMKLTGQNKNYVVEKLVVPYYGLSRDAVYDALARDRKQYPDLWR